MTTYVAFTYAMLDFLIAREDTSLQRGGANVRAALFDMMHPCSILFFSNCIID